MLEPPKPTGKPPTPVTLAGKVMPWARGQPVLLEMPMSIWRYLPLFDSPESLSVFLTKAEVEWESIKQVDDVPEFLSNFDGTDIKIICDPRFTDTGRIRFHQIQ